MGLGRAGVTSQVTPIALPFTSDDPEGAWLNAAMP
jgi:hypothetical protein